jgi:hypothetical protein
LAEEDVNLLDCIETLKKFHAALSKQQKKNFGFKCAGVFRTETNDMA